MIKRTFTEQSLNGVFFDVERVPLTYETRLPNLFNSRISVEVPNNEALINKRTGQFLSVVSKRYNVITNKDAYDLASKIVGSYFPGATLDKFKTFNVVYPSTMTTCRMDFILPENFYNPFPTDGEDKWTPFIRISNSFNKTIRLSYEIGFCRWICLNGMIFGGNSIKLKVNHTEGNYYNAIMKQIREQSKKVQDAQTIWESLSRKLVGLRSFDVKEDDVLPLYCKAFDVSFEEERLTEKIKDNWKKRKSYLDNIRKDYFKEMGNNAYAVMNILTDFASHNVLGIYSDGYQRKVGNWVEDFIGSIKKPGFSLDSYLAGDPRKAAELIKNF